MKKTLVLLLVLLMISQAGLCAQYKAYPKGDGFVEIVGEKNADSEITFLIKDESGTSLLDVGQVGIGEGDFSKELFICDPDEKIYNIEIGSTIVKVKNVSAASALEEVESATAEEFEAVLNGYKKIFNVDTTLIEPVYDKALAYNALAAYDFTTPENVATEYADVVNETVNNEKLQAYELILNGKSDEAIAKYLAHFSVDAESYSQIASKNYVYNALNGKKIATDSEFESAFADAVIIAQICEATDDDFIALVRAEQEKIGIDLSESANIADIVFAKVDAGVFNSFESIKRAFTEEISLNKLNIATEDSIMSVLKDENSVLGILDVDGYAELSDSLKALVCKVLARTDYDTIKAAKDDFALIVKRAAAGQSITAPPSSSSGGGGGSYAVSGGSAGISGAPVQSVATLPFIDLASSHWAYASVASLYSQSIISGTSATTFEPDRLVTREEFVKMLVGTFGLYSSNAKNVFADVAENHWSVGYLASAYEKGLTQGKGNGIFGIGETLTREDMAVLAARCAHLANLVLVNVNSNEFTDEAAFSSYALNSIYELSGAGIINGVGDGAFSPKTGCTRAMAAKVCSELLKLYQGGGN